MTSGIYRLRCEANDKVYVGRSVRIEKRLEDHRRSLRKGNHYNVHLQGTWDKYGEESFIFEILQEACEDLEQIETQLINDIPPHLRMNLVLEGSGGATGRPVTDEHRLAVSRGLKGKPKSQEHREALSRSRTGKPGHKHTPETKAKIREKGRLRRHSVAAKNWLGTVVTVTDSCGNVQIFPTQKAAAAAFGLSREAFVARYRRGKEIFPGFLVEVRNSRTCHASKEANNEDGPPSSQQEEKEQVKLWYC